MFQKIPKLRLKKVSDKKLPYFREPDIGEKCQEVGFEPLKPDPFQEPGRPLFGVGLLPVIFEETIDERWAGPNAEIMKELASNVARVHSMNLLGSAYRRGVSARWSEGA